MTIYSEFIYLTPIIHRIGLTLALLSSFLLYLLPFILSDESDKPFIDHSINILKKILYSGIIILILSGIFRLEIIIPKLLPFKLGFVTITIIVIIKFRLNYNDKNYQRNSLYILLSLLATTVMAIIMELFP